MDRRDFLVQTGTLLAGATLAPRSLAMTGSAQSASTQQPGRHMLPINRNWRYSPTNADAAHAKDFDDASFDQNGHIRVDFGLDTPWILEDSGIDDATTLHIQKNVEMLLAFTLSVEKHCGISSRLLWTESGEPLAEKLIARLQRLN